MSSTMVYFPPLSQTDLTPLERADLERAVWEMEAMNALLRQCSLPPFKTNGVEGRNGRADKLMVADQPEAAAKEQNVCEGTAVVSQTVAPLIDALSHSLPHEKEPPSAIPQDVIADTVISSRSNIVPCDQGEGECQDSDDDDDDDYSCFEIVQRRYIVPRVPLRVINTNAEQGRATEQSLNPTQRSVIKQKENIRHCPAVRRKAVPRYSQSPFIPIQSAGAQAPPEPMMFMIPTPLAPPPRRRIAVPVTPAIRNAKISLQDFSLKHVLGSGAQGKVYLARAEAMAPSRLLAIKVINKHKLSQQYDFDLIAQEQRVLKRLRGHPFILQLEASFHDTSYFYLITEYHGGGDLQKALCMNSVFDLERTRFYAAEMVTGIQYLHKNNIIHRDIKLANVMLKADGHIAIADFGLVKEFDFTSKDDGQASQVDTDADPLATSCCGTPCYMAPEMLNRECYGFEVDWWALGICVYAMLQGDVPWDNKDLNLLQMAIFTEGLCFRPDIVMDDHAMAFIEGLLQKNSKQRLGVAGIFGHQFFKDINWADLELLDVRPPCCPTDDGEILADGKLPAHHRFMSGLSSSCFSDTHPEYQFIGPNMTCTGAETESSVPRIVTPRTVRVLPRVPVPAYVPLSVARDVIPELLEGTNTGCVTVTTDTPPECGEIRPSDLAGCGGDIFTPQLLESVVVGTYPKATDSSNTTQSTQEELCLSISSLDNLLPPQETPTPSQVSVAASNWTSVVLESLPLSLPGQADEPVNGGADSRKSTWIPNVVKWLLNARKWALRRFGKRCGWGAGLVL